MDIAYFSRGGYSDEILIAYVKAYFKMNSTNWNWRRLNEYII
jgi:hypothetical protein